MTIRCCNGCVPPKRTPTCHCNCPDFIAEKLIEDLRNEARRKQNDISIGIHEQRSRVVNKAMKYRRGGGRHEQ